MDTRLDSLIHVLFLLLASQVMWQNEKKFKASGYLQGARIRSTCSGTLPSENNASSKNVGERKVQMWRLERIKRVNSLICTCLYSCNRWNKSSLVSPPTGQASEIRSLSCATFSRLPLPQWDVSQTGGDFFPLSHSQKHKKVFSVQLLVQSTIANMKQDKIVSLYNKANK